MFPSFFLAGFEGTTGYNAHGQWIDQVAATAHGRCALEDYRRLGDVGIRAAREAVRWPLVDRRGRYDFSSLKPFLDAARECRVQLIYDLFHFGYPDDADPLAPTFAARFAEYCRAAARYVTANSDGPYYFTPVNEPSYFAWAAGEAKLFAPHLTGRAPELKTNLIRACVEGINAIWSVCADAVIIHADPVCRVVAPADRPDLSAEAAHFNDRVVFESLDMLCGRLRPELGGSPRHLGVVGINYYWTNQWDLARPGVPLAEDDPRRAPLGEIVRGVWERYGADVMITETGHVGGMRAAWLGEVSREASALLDAGVPLKGVCLYPILGMPEWHAPHIWTQMGLGDLVPDGLKLNRVAYEPMLAALHAAQETFRTRPGRPALPTARGDEYFQAAR
jgi:hypothetical protein